jgi:hypothetical protein
VTKIDASGYHTKQQYEPIDGTKFENMVDIGKDPMKVKNAKPLNYFKSVN